MKKILLTLSLFVTCSAWADWIKVSETNNNTFYIDIATIRKDGDLRKVWTIRDFRKRDTSGALSSRTREEYNCKNERSRNLSISTHSEHMADGHTIVGGQFSNSNWEDIAPETPPESILKIVCAS